MQSLEMFPRTEDNMCVMCFPVIFKQSTNCGIDMKHLYARENVFLNDLGQISICIMACIFLSSILLHIYFAWYFLIKFYCVWFYTTRKYDKLASSTTTDESQRLQVKCFSSNSGKCIQDSSIPALIRSVLELMASNLIVFNFFKLWTSKLYWNANG